MYNFFLSFLFIYLSIYVYTLVILYPFCLNILFKSMLCPYLYYYCSSHFLLIVVEVVVVAAAALTAAVVP